MTPQEGILPHRHSLAAPLRPLLKCSWGSATNGRLGTGMYEDALFPELLPE